MTLHPIFGVSAAAAPVVPAGTVMLFHQETVPTGWTRVTTAAIDKRAMVVDTLTALGSFTGSKGGANEFATALNGTIASGTHAGTTPSHNHQQRMSTNGTSVILAQTVATASGGSTPYLNNTSGDGSGGTTAVVTNSGGAGGTHAHTIDVQVAYVNLFLASKD